MLKVQAEGKAKVDPKVEAGDKPMRSNNRQGYA
jgi:hypothetical protein